MNITITIPDAKVNELKTGSLKAFPVPTPPEGQAPLTELQWIKKWIRIKIVEAYKRGKNILAREQTNLEITEEDVT